VTNVQNPLETLDYVTATAVSSPAAETAILSTDNITAFANPADQQPGTEVVAPQVVRPVKIECTLNITTGTSSTAFVVKCRQGVGTGGVQVGASITVTSTAGSNYQASFVFRDSSGAPFSPAGTPYTITITETAATVAGTVNAIDIEVKQ
jgi:hypothetical protein